MARSQVIVSSGFAVLGLVVGLTVGALFGPGSHPQPLGVPDDSPVVVRGGSVEGLGATAWQKISSNPEVWELQGVDTTTVSMDGVIPSGTTTVQSVSASSLTTDWSLTLSFRDQGDHDNTDYQLQICTNPSCSTTGPLSKTL